VDENEPAGRAGTEGAATPQTRRGRRGVLGSVLLGLVAGLAGAALVLVVDRAGDDESAPAPTSAATGATATTPVGGRSPSWVGVAQAARRSAVSLTVTTVVDVPAPPGAGFVLDTDGSIVTCAHVVSDATAITVRLADGTSAKGTLVGADTTTDLAIVHVEVPSARLHPLPLGSAGSVAVGQPVLAVGDPFGFEGSASAGIVSGLEREIESPSGWTITDAIQTDAALNHGNSGGPLLDVSGRVIGVSAQIASSGVDANVGVAFAVPIDDFTKKVLRELRADGRASHAWLGIAGQTIQPELVATGDVEASSGILVTGVAPDSPAESAGLEPGRTPVEAGGTTFCVGGDAITAVDGKATPRVHDLQDALERLDPGDEAVLTVVRTGGGTKEVRVTLASQPTEPPALESAC
jgi:S1-C subfamily serine protease